MHMSTLSIQSLQNQKLLYSTMKQLCCQGDPLKDMSKRQNKVWTGEGRRRRKKWWRAWPDETGGAALPAEEARVPSPFGTVARMFTSSRYDADVAMKGTANNLSVDSAGGKQRVVHRANRRHTNHQNGFISLASLSQSFWVQTLKITHCIVAMVFITTSYEVLTLKQYEIIINP